MQQSLTGCQKPRRAARRRPLRDNAGMDGSVLWRAAAVQGVSVALLSIALGLALPRSFFVDWGWLAGPAAWLLCALISGAVLRLPVGQVLVGAALAGLPSLLAVAIGVHWLGAVFGVVLFALWCARLARDRDLTAHAI
jgi:uncharacterized membrane protein